MWREFAWRLKKPARTAQSYFPFLKDAKDSFYFSYRRMLRIPSEPFFRAIQLLESKLTGCYVDVGGNTGQSIEAIRLYAPSARIVSFEPNPGLAAKLGARYKDDDLITIRDIGLSDKEGRFNLHVPSYRGFVYDGLGSLDLDAARSWICRDTVYFFDQAELAVKSFDCTIETLDMQNIENPIFIKIDVEGTEYRVLKGGMNILKQYEPILLIEGLHEKPEIQIMIGEIGYAPYQFNGISFVAGLSQNSTFLITQRRMDEITRHKAKSRPPR